MRDNSHDSILKCILTLFRFEQQHRLDVVCFLTVCDDNLVRPTLLSNNGKLLKRRECFVGCWTRAQQIAYRMMCFSNVWKLGNFWLI